jgi:predicted enzyme related to lactoylglutathione lyase
MEAATETTRPQPRYHALVHFEIPTDSPEKVARFYEQLFDWKISKMPMGASDYWLIAHPDAGPNETMGGIYKKTMGESGFLNYFGVANIDLALAKAESLGAKVVKAKEEIPDIGWFAIVQDPENNTFALFQGKPM